MSELKLVDETQEAFIELMKDRITKKNAGSFKLDFIASELLGKRIRDFSGNYSLGILLGKEIEFNYDNDWNKFDFIIRNYCNKDDGQFQDLVLRGGKSEIVIINVKNPNYGSQALEKMSVEKILERLDDSGFKLQTGITGIYSFEEQDGFYPRIASLEYNPFSISNPKKGIFPKKGTFLSIPENVREKDSEEVQKWFNEHNERLKKSYAVHR